MSVINDAQTNCVCALSVHSYFCLNTAQYIHVVEYSDNILLPTRSKCHREEKKSYIKIVILIFICFVRIQLV